MEHRVPLFGAFLRPESPLYGEFHQKYKSRLSEMEGNAIRFHEAFSRLYPDAAPYLEINFLNIKIAISRYFNDLIRLRSMHNIYRLHRTKIAAYTAKWVWLNPIFFSSCDLSESDGLCPNSKSALSNANFIFISEIISYFLPEGAWKEHTFYKPLVDKIIYTMKIGVYEEHMAAALLESICPIIFEVDKDGEGEGDF